MTTTSRSYEPKMAEQVGIVGAVLHDLLMEVYGFSQPCDIYKAYDHDWLGYSETRFNRTYAEFTTDEVYQALFTLQEEGYVYLADVPPEITKRNKEITMLIIPMNKRKE